jgi:hypothetical protein
MGLDVVAFVMDIEAVFELAIPDEVAETLLTPRMLIDYLHGELPRSRVSRCLSQRAFYAVRRALCERFGLPRHSLCPTTEIRTLQPLRDDGGAWAEVGRTLGYEWWPRPRGDGWFARMFLSHRPHTLGELAFQLATFTPGALKPPGEGWSWQEVLQVVDGLMWEHFAIREYALDDNFVDDLGLY